MGRRTYIRGGGLDSLRALSVYPWYQNVAATGKSVEDAARVSLLPTARLQPLSGAEIAVRICQREGPLGLWRGTLATMLSLAPNSAVWWLTHEEAKQCFARRLSLSEDHALVHGWSGALAGVTSTIATNPLDVIKTRIQCSDKPASALAVVRGVLQETGLRGLYSGLIPRLAAQVPRSVCTVLAYERAIALCRTKPTDASGW